LLIHPLTKQAEIVFNIFMSVLKIITYPSPRLRKKSKAIEIADMPQYKNFITEMINIMIAKDGVGLAAPQVGKNINAVVINKEIAKTKDHLVLCNPKITFFSAKKIILEEGCLSVPNFYGEVKRPEKIRMKAGDINGKPIIIKTKGLLARVIQHEVDHLNGILFIDKLENK